MFRSETLFDITTKLGLKNNTKTDDLGGFKNMATNYIGGERKGVVDVLTNGIGILQFNVVNARARYDWESLQNAGSDCVEHFDYCFREDISDALLFVENAKPYYIRQGKWYRKGTDDGGIIPCTNYSNYVPLSIYEKNNEYPIIATGIAAYFIYYGLCKYPTKKGEDDYRLKVRAKSDLFQHYFSTCWSEYKEDYNSFEYDGREDEVKASFIKGHIEEERQYLKECSLDSYPLLKKYALKFGEDYIKLLEATQQTLTGKLVRPKKLNKLEKETTIVRYEFDNNQTRKIEKLFKTFEIEEIFKISMLEFKLCAEQADFAKMICIDKNGKESLKSIVCYIIREISSTIITDAERSDEWLDKVAQSVTIKGRSLDESRKYINDKYAIIKNEPKYKNGVINNM